MSTADPWAAGDRRCGGQASRPARLRDAFGRPPSGPGEDASPSERSPVPGGRRSRPPVSRPCPRPSRPTRPLHDSCHRHLTQWHPGRRRFGARPPRHQSSSSLPIAGLQRPNELSFADKQVTRKKAIAGQLLTPRESHFQISITASVNKAARLCGLRARVLGEAARSGRLAPRVSQRELPTDCRSERKCSREPFDVDCAACGGPWGRMS